MSLHKLYLRATSFAIGAKIFVAFASVIVLWEINAIAGKDTFGYVMLAFSLDYILASAVATLFQTVMMFHVSRDHETQNRHVHLDKVGAALFFSVLFGLIFTLIQIAGAGALSQIMNKPEAAPWFSAMAWMIPAFAANSTLTTWYRAKQDVPTMVIYFEILPNILRLSALIPMFFWTITPLWIAWAFALSYALPFMALYIKMPVRLVFKISQFSSWDLTYGIQNMLTQLVTKSLRNIVIFLIGFFASAGVVADYSLAMRFGQFVQIPKLALSQLQVPRMGRLMKTGQFAALSREFKVITMLSLTFTLLGAAFFFVAASFIFEFFGHYQSAVPIFYILIIDSIILSGFGAVGGYISIAGYAREGLIINILSLLILMLSVLILVPLYSGTGAAIATGIGSFSAMATMAALIWHKDKVKTQSALSMLVMAAAFIIILCAVLSVIDVIQAALLLLVLNGYGLYRVWPMFKNVFLRQDTAHA